MLLVNFVKFSRTPFLQNTSGRLPLEVYGKDFHIILPYQFEPEKEENAEETLPKFLEREGSISLFSFYGQLPAY